MEGSSEAKKPKGALAVLAFGGEPAKGKEPRSVPKGGTGAEYDDEHALPDAHEMAFESYADSANIPSAQRPRAMSALKEFVRACMREYGSTEE